MKRYVPKEIEPKWQKVWADSKIYQATENSDKPKIYATPMFPYPSGAAMHTGHVRNFAIADVVARYYRQTGHNTLTTMAWDAFGLPAENFAIKTGTPPAVTTAKNTAYFKEQMLALGISYDWSREFTTSHPEYYRWTQWVFALMHQRGLAYQAEKAQWWCDKCKTVLADEQVIAGKCWRHDGPDDPLVTKKLLKQWFFKITDYADDILEATDALNWPEKIKTMQKNWIGRSKGASITFRVQNSQEEIEAFTTRPDTIFGATFLVLAPEHPLVDTLTVESEKPNVDSYVADAIKKDDIERASNKDKTGVFTGGFVVNPVTGKEIPVWVADYVLMGYGSGAIMAVPAHDERDKEFAQKFELPIMQVVKTTNDDPTAEGVMVNSGEYDDMASSEAREKIVADLKKQGVAKEKTTYKIRDWLISRQRYWGAPIPIIHCPDHGAVLVPEDQLPVTLPEVKDFAPDGSHTSILARATDWVNTTCPTCGKPAKRETDTMDGYVCSTWYLHRYTDAHNDKQAFDPAKADYWFPLDFYFGADHAVAHLLYVRFFQRVLADAGIARDKEPIKQLVYNGYINAEDGSKMSKSKGNTVDPMDIIDDGYGADALRVFELFIAPYEQDTSWNTNGVPGAYRFLQRTWTLVQEFLESKDSNGDGSEEILRSGNVMIKKVTEDLQNMSFNTAVAAMMTAVNSLYAIKATHGYGARDAWQSVLESLAQLLGPFAPHFAEEIWQQLGHTDTVHVDHWPTWDDVYLVSDTMNIVVQVNGKVRANISVGADADKETVLAAAKADKKVASYTESGTKKEIYVPGKLVNFVV